MRIRTMAAGGAAALLSAGLAIGGASAASARTHPVLRPSAHAIRIDPMIRSRNQAGMPRNEVKSINWSGYAVSGKDGAYKSVTAYWTEPGISCAGVKSGTLEYVAYWDGLDGWANGTVEQTGTADYCDGTSAYTYSWYEMYPASPVVLGTISEPGDKMFASVTFSGTKTYTLVLKDKTAGWTKTEVINKSGLDRSSAEVITEAPGGGTYPLPDFGKVSYTASQDNGKSMDGQKPIKIVIDDSSGNLRDSTSSMSSAGNFSNTWLMSNGPR